MIPPHLELEMVLDDAAFAKLLNAPRKVVPLGDRVLVEPKAAGEEKTAGGIIVNVVGEQKPVEGTVLAVGADVTTLRPGAAILYGKFAGMKLEVDKVEYLVLREGDVVARLEG